MAILFHGRLHCGGSIISKDWIITAGHCVVDSAEFMSIRAGSTRYNSGGKVHLLEKLVTHENFFFNYVNIPSNDIALLKLKTPLDMDDSIQPISMFEPLEYAEPGSMAVITGWGTLLEEGLISSTLQTVSIPIVSKEYCSSRYTDFGGIPTGQICTIDPTAARDACQGDSGGPLTLDGRLAGVVSWGLGCARPGYPGVYSEIAYYRDWIQNIAGL